MLRSKNFLGPCVWCFYGWKEEAAHQSAMMNFKWPDDYRLVVGGHRRFAPGLAVMAVTLLLSGLLALCMHQQTGLQWIDRHDDADLVSQRSQSLGEATTSAKAASLGDWCNLDCAKHLEARGQKSEVRDQRSEAGSGSSGL
jgi:hypothetical protein